MSEFHFLRPIWLLGLPLLALLCLWLWRRRSRAGRWQAVCDPALLPHLLLGAAAPVPRRGLLLIALTGSLGLLALAGPTWERLPQPLYRDQSALVIALDLSASMEAGDLPPSRLSRARHKITDLLQRRPAGQMALVVYAAEAFAVTPLTEDADTIEALLPSLDTQLMPSQGSRPDRALELARTLLQQAGVGAGQILLISDGPSEAFPKAALQALVRDGHRLSVLGVGTPEGAPIPRSAGGFLKDEAGQIVIPRLDETGLRRLAREGGGRYARMQLDDRDLDALLNVAPRRGSPGERAEGAPGFDQWREAGPWLLLLALPLAALAFRRGALVMVALWLLQPPPPALAVDFQDLWRRPDQQAAAALDRGDAQRAARLFQDPRWKAAAQYRAGRFAEAAQTLEGLDQAEAHYNRGNALARAGRLPEAIASYRRALELAPDHEDARYNLDLLQQAMASNQPPAGDPNKQQPGQGNEGSDTEATKEGGTPEDPETRPGEGATDASSSAGEPDQQRGQQASSTDPAPGHSKESGNAQGATTGKQPAPTAAGEGAPRDTEPGETEHKTLARADAGEESTGTEAAERWLRAIPDDPGGLLRRKFLYQYRQRGQREPEAQPW